MVEAIVRVPTSELLRETNGYVRDHEGEFAKYKWYAAFKYYKWFKAAGLSVFDALVRGEVQGETTLLYFAFDSNNQALMFKLSATDE